MKPCRFCRQPIHAAATRCQHCHADQPKRAAGSSFSDWWLLPLQWLLMQLV